MSKQPSERAFDVASDWQGHKFDCAIHRDPGRDDADCTCIVRDLARAIDAAIAAATKALAADCGSAYRFALALERARDEAIKELDSTPPRGEK